MRCTKIKADLLYVTHRYYPNTGGVEKHVYELSKRIADKVDVAVVTADLKPKLSEFEEVDGVKVYRFSSLSPRNAYYFCPQIYQAVKRSDCNVIHAHNYHAFPAYMAFKAKNKVPFVFTPHYHGKGSNFVRNVLFKIYDLIARSAIEKADMLICVSELERRALVENYDVDPVVIPNGVDLDFISRVNADCKMKDYVLYVGRLEKYKNVQVLIETAKIGGFKLVIAGTGNYEKRLQEIVRKEKLLDKVTFLGYVDEAEKIRLMKCCRAFVNLSSVEAFGITALEALACGKPVIVNKNSGLRELLKFKNVHGINPTAEELVDVLNRINSKTDPKTCTSEQLLEYDWKTIAKKHLKLYRELGGI